MTAPRWSRTPRSRSSRGSGCWSRASPAPARARWCARFPGLWPWGEGTVQVQKGREDVPDAAEGLRADRHIASRRDLSSARRKRRARRRSRRRLKHVGLEHLVDRIEEEAPWDQTLSGGEKQRLAFARILLHEPDIIVLDEATSALDPDSQDKLMKLLTEELKATTIVSVGHRPELEQFHDRKITLERRRGGAKLVNDVELVPPAQPPQAAAALAGAAPDQAERASQGDRRNRPNPRPKSRRWIVSPARHFPGHRATAPA